MTANHRTIPMDELSLKEKHRTITIRKRHDEIEVGISDGWISFACFEFDELYSILERLVRPGVTPTPSSDDKNPTAATGEANRGTQEFKVGDEVKLPDITTGTILSLNTDGTMAVGMLDGTVRYTNTQEVVRL